MKKNKVFKAEKGGILRQKLVDYLDKNGNELSKEEQRRIRKGIQDINPNLYYVNVDGGYVTYKQDDKGNFYQSDDFGAGIYRRDPKLSSRRSGIAQSILGGRKTTAYGGKENPKRVRDAITLAKELSMLKTQDELGISTSGNNSSNTSQDNSSENVSSVDDLIGTTPTSTLQKDGIDYVIFEGNEIPVKLDKDGKITEIISIEKARDITGSTDDYETGIEMFDKENVEESIDDSDQDSQQSFTDPAAFQRFLVDKAKEMGESVTGAILGVKKSKEIYDGVQLDHAVGSKTLAFAKKLGVDGLWKGSTYKSNLGTNNTLSTIQNTNSSTREQQVNSQKQEDTNYFPTLDDEGEIESDNTEYGQKLREFINDPNSYKTDRTSELNSLLEGYKKETGNDHLSKESFMYFYDLNKPKNSTNKASDLFKVEDSRNITTRSMETKKSITNEKTERLDKRIKSLFDKIKLSPNHPQIEQRKTVLNRYLVEYKQEAKADHPLQTQIQSFKKGGKVKNSLESLSIRISGQFSKLKNKSVINKSEMDMLKADLEKYKTMSGTQHPVSKDISILEKGIKKPESMKNGGVNNSLDYLDFLNGKEGEKSQGFFKQGGVYKFFSGGVKPGFPYKDILSGKIFKPGDTGYDPSSPTAMPIDPSEISISNSNTSSTNSTSTTQNNNNNNTSTSEKAENQQKDEDTDIRETADGKVNNLGQGVLEYGKGFLGKNNKRFGKGFGLDHTTTQYLTSVATNLANSNRIQQRKPQAQEIFIDTIKRNPAYANLEKQNKEMFSAARARSSRTSDPTLNAITALSLNSQQIDSQGKLAEAEAQDYNAQRAAQRGQRQQASAQRINELNQSIAIDNQADLAEDQRKDQLRSTLANATMQYADAKKFEKEEQRKLGEDLYINKMNQETQSQISELSNEKVYLVNLGTSIDKIVEKVQSGVQTPQQAEEQLNQIVTMYNNKYPNDLADISNIHTKILTRNSNTQNDINKLRATASNNAMQVRTEGALIKNYEYAPFSNPYSHLTKVQSNKNGGTNKDKEQLKREKFEYKKAKEVQKAQLKQKQALEKRRQAVSDSNMKQWLGQTKQYYSDVSTILNNIEKIKRGNNR